jgi:hypothetical protein
VPILQTWRFDLGPLTASWGQPADVRIGAQATAPASPVYRIAAPHARIAVREHGVLVRRFTAERGRQCTATAIGSVEDQVVQQVVQQTP